jgi:hypothetical protein
MEAGIFSKISSYRCCMVPTHLSITNDSESC